MSRLTLSYGVILNILTGLFNILLSARAYYAGAGIENMLFNMLLAICSLLMALILAVFKLDYK